MVTLADAHQAQLGRYLSFFKGKRERLINDRASDLDEFKSDQCADDAQLYNKTDVENLLDTYHAVIVGCIREEVENMVNISAVYVSELFSQAQQLGITLDSADVSLIEDKTRVDQIKMMMSSGGALPLQPMASRNPTLPTLAPGGAQDPAMLQENQDLKEQNRQMNDRYQQMQHEVSQLLKERSVMLRELEEVKSNFAQLRAMQPETAGNNQINEIERRCMATQGMLDAKKAECDAMSRDLNQRLGDSTQFKELKAIVKKKSQEVIQLRKQLEAHGLAPVGTAGGVDLAPEDD